MTTPASSAPEELTAAERAALPVSERFPDGRAVSRLLVLYDAALARAEAAETLRVHAATLGAKAEGGRAVWLNRALAAESRLASAVKLLRRCRVKMLLAFPCYETAVAVDAFLSTAPAQAAEPHMSDYLSPAQAAERPNDGRSGRCGIRVSGDHWCTRDVGHPGNHDSAQAAEPAADQDSITFPELERRTLVHKDTIALRECRAESQKRLDATNALREALESTRAELAECRAELERADKEKCADMCEAARLRVALEKLRAELATAKTELENVNADLERNKRLKLEAAAERDAALESVRVLEDANDSGTKALATAETALRALQQKVAKAVEELEGIRTSSEPRAVGMRALEALQ